MDLSMRGPSAWVNSLFWCRRYSGSFVWPQFDQLDQPVVGDVRFAVAVKRPWVAILCPVVPLIADQPALDRVDLLLRRVVHHVGRQAGQPDRVLLVLEQLQLQRLLQA